MPTTSPDRPLRILVIEDDLIFQKIIQTYLRQAPPRRAQVTLAKSLGEGLGHLGEQSCDAVLLDLTLPDSEGLGTLERLQSRVPDVPVIVHVTPRGAMASSAGVFITMSAHVAAMSPSTTIG